MANANKQSTKTLDPGQCRILQNYGDALGSKELLKQVSFRKLSKDRFFWRNSKVDANSIDVYFYEENTFDLVSPEVANMLGGLSRAVTLHLAIDRANAPFFISVPRTDANAQRNS